MAGRGDTALVRHLVEHFEGELSHKIPSNNSGKVEPLHLSEEVICKFMSMVHLYQSTLFLVVVMKPSLH